MHNEITKNINGKDWVTIPFGASKQLRMLPGLLRLLAGPVGMAVDLFKDLKTEDHVSLALKGIEGPLVQQSLVEIAKQLEDGGNDTILSLLENTFVKNSKGMKSAKEDFDDVFSRDFKSLFLVLAWVVQENYAPFLNLDSIGSVALMKSKERSRQG